MMRSSAAFLLVLIHLCVRAQPSADFSFPDELYSVCQNEDVRLVNSSSGADNYYWDFCPETFAESPNMSSLSGANAFAGASAYKLVRQGNEWFGFTVSRSNNKIFRLDFGSDPSSVPEVIDLGNPGGFLNSPEGLDIYNHAGNWYGFVGYNGDIIRLDCFNTKNFVAPHSSWHT